MNGYFFCNREKTIGIERKREILHEYIQKTD